MTVDSSALVAIIFAEAGHLDLIDRVLEADHVRVGAPTLAETSIVVAARTRKPLHGVVESVIEELGITVVPFGEAEWRAATDAYLRFGRGRHPAGLNFGDCLAYATARVAHDKLLFVGKDFAKTDIVAA
jgi:ribonuclease VapC